MSARPSISTELEARFEQAVAENVCIIERLRAALGDDGKLTLEQMLEKVEFLSYECERTERLVDGESR